MRSAHTKVCSALAPVFTIGVSLKMYFSHAQTLEWSRAVADICARHPAVASGLVEFFVMPTYPAIPAVLEIMKGLTVGAQDISAEDSGAFTGEVSGAELYELGCRVVEVGHAERRNLYCETDEVVAAKVRAALRSGLVPIVCIGENEQMGIEAAVSESVGQARSALEAARVGGERGRVIFAYEPNWAIGAEQPAEPSYIRQICAGIREEMELDEEFPGPDLIYGGSAGPGLLPQVASAVSGLFLGRFAHDPSAVALILDEAYALAESPRWAIAHSTEGVSGH
jgi:triosephosphate isomerase